MRLWISLLRDNIIEEAGHDLSVDETGACYSN